MYFKEHIKETIKLAVPISLGQLGHIMMGVVDNIMIGKVGYAPLAAASLVNGLFFLIIVFGIGMTFASTPLIAIAKGAAKNKECGTILNHSVIVNFVFSILLIVMTYSLSFIIPHLNQPQEVVDQAIPYLRVLTISIVPFILFQCYRQFLEGLSIPNPPMVISILANILNAFLNWILIFGNLGFEALGLLGAGIATTITRWVMAGTLFFYVINNGKLKMFNPKPNFKVREIPLIKKLIEIGLPSGFQYFLEVAAFAFAAVMIGWLGAKSLAAHQIAINLASATYMIILGISSAGTIRVSNGLGKKNVQQIRNAGFSALGLSAFVMFVFALIFIVFRNTLPYFYNNNLEVVEIASTLLIIAALFQVFDGLQATGIGVLRGLTDVRIPLLLSLFSYWIIAIPLSYFLGFSLQMGVKGIWIGLLFGLLLIAILLFVRFNIKSKTIIEQ